MIEVILRIFADGCDDERFTSGHFETIGNVSCASPKVFVHVGGLKGQIDCIEAARKQMIGKHAVKSQDRIVCDGTGNKSAHKKFSRLRREAKKLTN